MPDRRAQILGLLDTRNDHLPDGTLRRSSAAAGFVHRTPAPRVCPTCDGVDTAHCPECRGRGEIEVMRTRDPYAIDHLSPAGITVKLGHVPARDAELDRLADQTAAPVVTELDLVAQANQHPYGWERARAAMYAQYDYHALDLALERLAGWCIPPYSDRGLELLDEWLPDPLRAPSPTVVVNVAARGPKADPKARQQRDEAILDMLHAGFAYGHIARTVGLTPRQLRRIVSAQSAAESEEAA